MLASVYSSFWLPAPTIFVKIDNQLRLNRRLLKHFNQAGKSTIRKEKLIEAGFNPKYFTHYWKNARGQVYLFCYDVGYLELKDNGKDKYLLIDYQDSYMWYSNANNSLTLVGVRPTP